MTHEISRYIGLWAVLACLTVTGCGPGSEGEGRLSSAAVDKEAPAGNEVTASHVTVKAGVPGATDAVAPVFRFAKISNGAYFFTGDPSERDLILAEYPDFRYEGTAFLRSAGSGPSLPVYRFANLLNGGYFYTASEAERDQVLQNYPHFRFESSSFSVASSDAPDAEPIFRLANLNNGAYLFTSSATERDAAAALGFWRSEGVAFHAPRGSGLEPLQDPAYRTPTWLLGHSGNSVYFIDPDQPGTAAQVTALASRDLKPILVATHRVHAESKRAWDPHIAHALIREGDTFKQANLVKGRGPLQWRQVSSENAASNTCTKSGVLGDRVFTDMADSEQSTYVYLRRDLTNVCKLYRIRVGMTASEAPQELPDGTPISALYDDQGAISGYLVNRAGELLRYDRNYANPQSIGSFGWNPGRVQSLLSNIAVLPTSQTSGGRPVLEGIDDDRYHGTAGWTGPAGRSIVVIGAYRGSAGIQPDRLFAYDDASRALVQLSRSGATADFLGSATAEEYRQSVARDQTHLYWVGGGGVWRYSLSFDAAPEQILVDADARQPVLLTQTRVVYHRAAGSNPSAHVVSVPKAGGSGQILSSAETADGRVRAVATSGETAFYNGSRSTSSTGSSIYSGWVQADGSGPLESQYSHWLSWNHKYSWIAGDSIVDRMLRVEQVPNSAPSATHVNLQLVSVDGANPTSYFALTSWSNPVNGLTGLGVNVLRPYTLPALTPRSLLAADFQANLGGLDLYLLDSKSVLFARKTLRNAVVP